MTTVNDSTEDLAPDEKRCPYCAETIKAAAIRCRFCQADLLVPPPVGPPVATASAGAPAREPEPVAGLDAGPDAGPELEPDDGAAPEGVEPVAAEPEQRAAAGADVRLVAVLVVLCLVLGGALWFVVDRSRHPELGTAPNGQVTQNSFRNAAMSAGSEAATRILSYGYKTFDADREKARALVTGQAAKEYEKAMDEVAPKAASAKLTLKATVLAVGTISVKEHAAKLLLFVNTVTTREGSKQQQLDQSRLVVDLTREDGDWTVSKMDAF